MLNITTSLVNTTDNNITTLNEILKMSITSQTDEVRQTRLVRLQANASHTESLTNTNILVIYSSQDISLTINAIVVGDPTNTPVPVLLGVGKWFMLHKTAGIDSFTIASTTSKSSDIKIFSSND